MSASTLVIAAAAKEEESNFLVPNGTFIAELVAFAILLWLIHRYVLPPLAKAMTARQDMIDRSDQGQPGGEGTSRGRRGRVSRASGADQG